MSGSQACSSSREERKTQLTDIHSMKGSSRAKCSTCHRNMKSWQAGLDFYVKAEGFQKHAEDKYI